MSADWQTYRLGDFIPFTPEVYFRLIERANAAFWPWQLATVALGLAALVLALRGNHRSALIALAPGWVISALAFHFDYYAEINVAATWFGWAFIAQAALLAIVAGWPDARSPRSRPGPIRKTVGTGIAALGIVAWPLLRSSWVTAGADPKSSVCIPIRPPSRRWESPCWPQTGCAPCWPLPCPCCGA